MFGRNGRFVFRFEWLTLWPNATFLPQISQRPFTISSSGTHWGPGDIGALVITRPGTRRRSLVPYRRRHRHPQRRARSPASASGGHASVLGSRSGAAPSAARGRLADLRRYNAEAKCSTAFSDVATTAGHRYHAGDGKRALPLVPLFPRGIVASVPPLPEPGTQSDPAGPTPGYEVTADHLRAAFE